jgi:CRISPR-associated protein Cas2
MMHVLAYDVVNQRRRTRLHRALKDFGTPVQRSVFEFDLEPKEVGGMMQRVARIIEPEEDTVRLYRICSSCQAETRILGEGVLSLDPDYYIV